MVNKPDGEMTGTLGKLIAAKGMVGRLDHFVILVRIPGYGKTLW